MKQLPTAEEYYTDNPETMEDICKGRSAHIKRMMIEFAKLHVEAQAKEIAEKAELSYADGKYDCPDYCEEPFNMTCDDLGNCHYIDRELILRIYPLENVK